MKGSGSGVRDQSVSYRLVGNCHAFIWFPSLVVVPTTAKRSVVLFGRFGFVFVAVEGKDGFLAFDQGFDMDWPRPEPVEVGQGVAGIVDLQIDTVVLVFEKKLAAVFVVAVANLDDRTADVGQTVEKAFFNFGEFAAFDVVGVGIFVVVEGEELVLAAKVEREELVDKHQVVVDAADFENFLAAEAGASIPIAALAHIVALVVFFAEAAAVPAIFDVAEQLDAEFIGIEPRGAAGHGAAVMVGIVDDVGGLKALAGHDGAVPVAGPTFVHDFGLGLWGEVIGFLADDREGVGLPRLERRVVEDKFHDVAGRAGGAFFPRVPDLCACGRLLRTELPAG